MQPLTAEWVAKAEGDWATALREFSAREAPNYDAVCFHAQQCAEKYLKARLQESCTPFPKTHDLAALLRLLRGVEPEWFSWRRKGRRLSAHAVESRYPGRSAGKTDAEEAIDICKEIRAAVRARLQLPA